MIEHLTKMSPEAFEAPVIRMQIQYNFRQIYNINLINQVHTLLDFFMKVLTMNEISHLFFYFEL